MCGKHFSIYGVQIPRKCIESMNFYSSVIPSLPLKTTGRIFLKICFPQDKMGGGNYDFFIKIQLKNMKMTWNISLFIFSMICSFS